MKITDYIFSLDKTLEIHNESEWSGGDEAKLYSAANSGGIECETGEFLYGFIRLIKPDMILETGTHVGVGALYLAQGCKDNGKGVVVTLEFLAENFKTADLRFQRAGLKDFIDNRYGDVKELYADKETQYDLMLLDTEPQTRFEELIQFYDNLKPGGFVFIHDLHRHMGQGSINPDHPNEPGWPWGEIPKKLKQLVKEGKLRPFHFSTPRGLTGFYKPTKDDYKWV
jgi:predicted O-methyltransferase YrrM